MTKNKKSTVGEQIEIEIGTGISDTSPCKTALQVALTMEKNEEFANDKLWQIFQILKKDERYIQELERIEKEDIDAIRKELLSNPDILKEFLGIVREKNIILKDPKSKKTVSRETLDKLPKTIQQKLNSEESDYGKILDSQLGLLDGKGEKQLLMIDTGPSFLGLESAHKAVINYDNFIKTINRYTNTDEIERTTDFHLEIIKKSKKQCKEMFSELAKSDGGKYAIYTIVYNETLSRDDKDILIPLLPDLIKTNWGVAVIYEIIKKEIFVEEDKDILIPLLPDLAKTNLGGSAIALMINKDIFTNLDNASFEALLPNLAKTNGGGDAIHALINKRIFTSVNKDILIPLLPDLAKTNGGGKAIYITITRSILWSRKDRDILMPLLPDLAKTDEGLRAIDMMVEKNIISRQEAQQ